MFHIIVNPTGGKGKSLKALEKTEKLLNEAGVEYEVHKTERKGHATEIVRELSKTPDTTLVVLGGDGSFNEVLNGIENFQNITLGLVPCGTGNDFVSASGHPQKVEDAVKLILEGNAQYIDFIQLDDRRCLNVLGAGMDVDVLQKYATMKPFHGKVKYYASLIYVLLHLKWHRLKFTIDGKELGERSTFMIGIGNGKSIGGGIPICPNGVVDDGKLSIVVINEVKKSLIPRELPGFLKAKHIGKPYTEQYEGEYVKIEVLDDSMFEADGEIFGGKEINCHIVTNTLKVFCPAKYDYI